MTPISHARRLLRASLPMVLAGAIPSCTDGAGPDDPGTVLPFPTTPRPSYDAIHARWPAPESVTGTETFTADSNHIRRDGEPFAVRGIVYVPGYPGYLPWEIESSTSLPERLTRSIDRDIAQIAAAGANTVRLWGAPAHVYRAVRATGSLFILQTIWIDPEAPDLHDPGFKDATRSYIRSVIDRIHGVFTDRAPPVVAYLVGNELSAATIQSTNAAHPDLTGYAGTYVAAQELTPSEVFLAEMADYVKSYEHDTYGMTHLVSYSNDIRTADLLDTPFLDFRSHNTYPYAVPYYRPGTAAGSTSGTLLQGWMEELKARFPDRPLLITETGLSVSPNAAHIGPPDYGYGGNTEAEQAAGLLQALDDAATAGAPIAGVVIHEFLDAWWKFGLEDSHAQDPDDVEEWFGLVRLIGD